ncbi:MAG: radical SAM protein [Desulfobacterales bacterium]
MKSKSTLKTYRGFEQGPIRPPSEANSLLIRVTRNCPWNRCRFCPVYKGRRFSLRPVEHVIEDIERVYRYVAAIRKITGGNGRLSPDDVRRIGESIVPSDEAALHAALHWQAGGMQSIFIQDANSLVIKPADLLAVLTRLRDRFPWVARITSYARSHTVARIADADLQAFAAAGLNRIHIGLESGSDRVLARMQKGITKAGHIKAGRKIKQAGMELSEYVMPGLGGRDLSREHALETADCLNQINPDFIRLRTLAIPNHTELHQDFDAGRFEKLTDREMARETLLFLETLDGIHSTVKSDHILNLFQEVEGRLPEDKAAMTAVIRRFLDLAPEDQVIYQVGRRLGLFSRLADMDRPKRRARAAQACQLYGIDAGNVDRTIDELMKRFI